MSTKTAGAYFTSLWFGDEWKAAMREAGKEALAENAANIVRSAMQNITNDGSIFTGTLRRSIGMNKVHDEGGEQVIDVGLRGGSTEKVIYGLVVEHGRKAGSKPPPSKELLPWVKRKIQPGQMSIAGHRAAKGDRVHDGNKTGRAYRQIKRGRRLENELKGLAFIIACSIGKKGTPARPYMRPAFDMHQANTREIFKRHLAEKLKAIRDPSSYGISLKGNTP